MERRAYPRLKTEIPAKVTGLLTDTQNADQKGTIRDLSESGILFFPENPRLGLGDPVKVTFSIPGSGAETAVEGSAVRWVEDPKVGMGIRFRNMTGETQTRIREYVR